MKKKRVVINIMLYKKKTKKKKHCDQQAYIGGIRGDKEYSKMEKISEF